MRKAFWAEGTASGLLNRETQRDRNNNISELGIVGEEILRCTNRKSWTVRLALGHEAS